MKPTPQQDLATFWLTVIAFCASLWVMYWFVELL